MQLNSLKKRYDVLGIMIVCYNFAWEWQHKDWYFNPEKKILENLCLIETCLGKGVDFKSFLKKKKKG